MERGRTGHAVDPLCCGQPKLAPLVRSSAISQAAFNLGMGPMN